MYGCVYAHVKRQDNEESSFIVREDKNDGNRNK